MILKLPEPNKKGKICQTYKMLCKCNSCEIEFHRDYSYFNGDINMILFCKSCATINYNKSRSKEDYKKIGEKTALKLCGITLKDRYGKEHADVIKAKMSLKASGENNPNFGGKYSRGFADIPNSGKFEDKYGKEKADAMKAAMSKRSSGKNNPMYGKPAPKRTGNGISGYYKTVYFRSLLELSCILYMEDNNILWESGENKKHKFNYKLNDVDRSYFPDFYLPNENYYLELKPKSLFNNYQVVAKIESVEAVGKIIVLKSQNDYPKITYEKIKFLIDNDFVKIDKTKQHRIWKE